MPNPCRMLGLGGSQSGSRLARRLPENLSKRSGSGLIGQVPISMAEIVTSRRIKDVSIRNIQRQFFR